MTTTATRTTDHPTTADETEHAFGCGCIDCDAEWDDAWSDGELED